MSAELYKKTSLIFRADGNSQIGLGHVIRCLALAELLNTDFSCQFAIQNPSPELVDQIKTICPEIIALPAQSNNLEKEAEELSNTLSGQEIIVLDGYQFSPEYQQLLKRKGNVLVCLDDLHDRPFVADAVINIAGRVSKNAYSVAPYTKLCLGPAYALLRKPFRDIQKTVSPEPEKVNRILICFGGADPENHTLQTIQNLLDLLLNLKLEIVIGSAYKHLATLQKDIADNPLVLVHQNLSAEEMAGLMQTCEAAITSASSVAYEYCAVNGMLFLQKTAANQTDLYNFLISENLALPVEVLAENLTSENFKQLAKQMPEKQRTIFNGTAQDNLTQLFHTLDYQARLTFRKFTVTDAELLFDWANDPDVRKYSFNPAPIPFETHLNWVKNKLADPKALLLLAEINNEPAAFIRFDKAEQTALISYQIGAKFRGKGLGHTVLLHGLQELKKHFPEVKEAVGFVQPINIASVRAFEKAEFENAGMDILLQAFKFTKAI